MSDKFKYISLDELLSSVRSDLHEYDNNSLILEDRLLKVIYRCNEKLGVKLNKSKQVLLEVKDGKADLPKDFFKIEMLFATCVTSIPPQLQLIPGNKATYTECIPDNTPMINVSKIACASVDNCCTNLWLIRQPQIQREVYINTFIPLSMSKRCANYCTSYYPGSRVRSDYSIDLVDDVIKTSFKEGQIFLCYLGSLEDEDGKPLIPFHPLLNEYYEWSLKKKILEDIYMNSEADVEKKLQYAKQALSDAYLEAWQFTGYPEHQEMERAYQKHSVDFYNKWFSIYQC